MSFDVLFVKYNKINYYTSIIRYSPATVLLLDNFNEQKQDKVMSILNGFILSEYGCENTFTYQYRTQ